MSAPRREDTPFVAILPHHVESVREARQMLREDLTARGLPESVVQDAVIVLSELLANSLRHAAPTGEGGVRISWRVDEDRLLLGVTDGGGSSPPAEKQASGLSTGGRGLAIVRQLSSTWGWRDEGDAVTVHAVLPLSELDLPELTLPDGAPPPADA